MSEVEVSVDVLTQGREFALLTREKRALEAKLAKVKSRLAKIDEPLREAMAQEGIPKLPLKVPEFDAQRDAEVALMEKGPDNLDPLVIQEVVDILATDGLLADSHPEKTATISISSRIWASPVINDPDRDKANDAEYERACDALEASDFGEYAQRRFNVVSLSSAMNNEVAEGRIKLGDDSTAIAFDGTIKITEKFQAQARMT
jgi:hypothetical protein